MIATVPADTPVTIPIELTVAVDILLLLHAPPPMLSLNVIIAPVHTMPGPEMADGNGFIVTPFVALQPAGKV